MSDIIHILPENVANQIAAGEVIQRPASVVKELMENAVDAGASQIILHIKDAGRTLIQISDNGKGMSFNDAQTAFLRHATSKISKAEDLFSLYTKGFRGEALASIAAVAQCELYTKLADEQTGTYVYAENSQVKEHRETACSEGTTFYIKNLFFNIPARRNFLKSDKIEMDHIHEEFIRIALIHTDINFQLFEDDQQVYHLISGNFKQRIINIFGNSFKEKLYAIEQNTDFMNIRGYITKPESAKKRKNEQYLFVNKRYIKHPSLNFAIENAFKQLIPEGYKPAYFIEIEVNPNTIDINISPTKVDIKFQDERLIFGFLNSTVKKTLGQICLVPILSFDNDKALEINLGNEPREWKEPTIKLNPDYNPFSNPNPKSQTTYGISSTGKSKNTPHSDEWKDFLESVHETPVNYQNHVIESSLNLATENEYEVRSFMMLYDEYLLINRQEQIWLVNISAAYERILYERYLNAITHQPLPSQQSLFPETIQLKPADADLLESLLPNFQYFGYDIVKQGQFSFVINGFPINDDENHHGEKIELLLEDYRSNCMLHHQSTQTCIALSFAKQNCKKYKKQLPKEEVEHLLKELFHCEISSVSPSGAKTIQAVNIETIKTIFKHS